METHEVVGIVLLLRDVVARSLFAKYQDDFKKLNRILDAYEPAANGVANTVAVGFVQERERIIREQQEAIRELSTPVLQVRERLLILPIIGAIDPQRGIHGYVLKSKASKDLVQAIRDVSRGLYYMSPEMSQTIIDSYRGRSESPSPTLSARERQVLQLVAEGKTTKEVATILGISVKTADTHRSRIMKKLDIHDVASLVRYAVRAGMVQP